MSGFRKTTLQTVINTWTGTQVFSLAAAYLKEKGQALSSWEHGRPRRSHQKRVEDEGWPEDVAQGRLPPPLWVPSQHFLVFSIGAGHCQLPKRNSYHFPTVGFCVLCSAPSRPPVWSISTQGGTKHDENCFPLGTEHNTWESLLCRMSCGRKCHHERQDDYSTVTFRPSRSERSLRHDDPSQLPLQFLVRYLFPLWKHLGLLRLWARLLGGVEERHRGWTTRLDEILLPGEGRQDQLPRLLQLRRGGWPSHFFQGQTIFSNWRAPSNTPGRVNWNRRAASSSALLPVCLPFWPPETALCLAFDFSLLTVCALVHPGANTCKFNLDGYPLAVTSYTQKCDAGTCLSTAYPTD